MVLDTPVQPASRIAISLTREELYVMMHLLKAKNIPGFNLEWLQATPDGKPSDEVRRSLEAATNALVARGYLTQVSGPTETTPLTLQIPSYVIALVGACAFGEYNMLLSLSRTPDGPQLLYIHKLRELGVLHTMPLPGIHQFEAITEREGILMVLDEMLHLHAQQKLSLPEGNVARQNVEAARDTALAEEIEQATSWLIQGGLAPETSKALTQALNKATILGFVGIIRRDMPESSSQGVLGLVVTPEVCFMLTDTKESSPTLHIQSISAAYLRKWIISFLHPRAVAKSGRKTEGRE